MHTPLTLREQPGQNLCQELLVRSWRLVMTRGVECPLVDAGFRCTCGAEGPQVFRAFCTFLCALALTQRRRLVVGPPGHRDLTPDETRMLAIISASQNDFPALLRAHLIWLAQGSLSHTLEQSTHELAASLSRHGLHIPLPALP